MSNKIGWTDVTINPVIGCSKVSIGCKNCYASDMASRLCMTATTPQYIEVANRQGWNGEYWYAGYDRTKEMFRKLGKIPKRVFVCSMGDLFYEKVQTVTIQFIFELMGHHKQHQFIILTKRPERIEEVLYGQDGDWFMGGGDYLGNVYIGTSVENQEQADIRIPHLLKFKDSGCDGWKVGVSCEPLLGAIDLSPYIDKLDWVIAGSETGKNARPAEQSWFEGICNLCERKSKPFYLKQMGRKQGEYHWLYNRVWHETAWGK